MREGEYRMKTVRFLTLCGVVFWLTCSAHARLGETPGLIEARYGKPITIHKDSVDPKYIKIDTGDSVKSASYRFNGFDIRVEFTKGRSTKEIFSKDELDSSDVETLLLANSDKKKWTPVTSEVPGTPVSHWKREDGVTAFLGVVHGTKHIRGGKNSLTITAAATGF